jgi:ornithine cyclodeaminase/alanine dehydrogenase-like protein (mu-crystallin family)
VKTLTDEDVDRLLPMKDAIRVMEDAFRAKSEGRLVSPPRFYVPFPRGSLVFTVGGDDVGASVVGFRMYNTFPGATEDGGVHPDRTQVTMVFDARNGALQGTILGTRLGVLRTSAIGGTALKYLANPAAERIGFIGSGLQARAQLEAAMAVLPLRTLRVYSPTPSHREEFARWASQKFGLTAEASASSREVVDSSEVVICSTVSSVPVIDAEWVRPGMHVTTMGSRTTREHEIGPAVAEQSDVIATDSPAQLSGYPEPHILHGTPAWGHILDLASIVASREKGRTSPRQRTLFLSEGLAGTEVLLAAELLRRTAPGTAGPP